MHKHEEAATDARDEQYRGKCAGASAFLEHCFLDYALAERCVPAASAFLDSRAVRPLRAAAVFEGVPPNVSVLDVASTSASSTNFCKFTVLDGTGAETLSAAQWIVSPKSHSLVQTP